MKPLRFIVVADSHIRLPGDDVDTYPSNALMVLRNEYVVNLCNRIDAEFVIHLGDIVHPLPVEPGHEAAVLLARSVYEPLTHPVHFTPGNHDIGDKPNALVAVPPVADENYAIYERYWGAAHRSFDVGNSHFAIVDTPVLNSGLEREALQRTWIEDDLRQAQVAGRRIFLFSHYPPFIRDRSEEENYDNLGEPARTWLLDLISDHSVEALFSGHVHNFLYNHHSGADLYVLPATGFVRPDYSELSAVAPEGEGGRDDPPKLGFFVVDVVEDGHHVRPIRTFGYTSQEVEPPVPLATALQPNWQSPVGVTLRHGWAATIDFPTSGLDEFNRKAVRSDATLAAVWEARITGVKVPVADVTGADRAERIRHLTGRGMRFTVRSAGVPNASTCSAIASLASVLARWEIITSPETFEEVVAAIAEGNLPIDLALAIGPIVSIGSADSSVHHFVSSGFAPDGDETLTRWLEADTGGRFAELVFRADGGQTAAEDVSAAGSTASRSHRRAIVNVELPRGGESLAFVDDQFLGEVVAGAVAAAREHPEVAVFLDGFMDHDRGYYPHHGLIDRHHNPRPALYRLMVEAAREPR